MTESEVTLNESTQLSVMFYFQQLLIYSSTDLDAE